MRRYVATLVALAFIVVGGGPKTAAAPPVGSPLGTNLAPVTDFTAEYPFVNHFKQARQWISGNDRAGVFDDSRSLKLDGNGYVKAFERRQVARTVLFTGLDADPELAGRRFVLTYSGRGSFSYSGAVALVEHTTRRDVIELQAVAPGDEALIVITLRKTDPDNRVRNIKLVPEGGVCASARFTRVASASECPGDDFLSFESNTDAIRFNPEFLDRVRNYSSNRFMDWMRTNDSPIRSFAQRAKHSHAFWSKDAGVPLEVMIELANLLDVDPWFNVPHRTDNSYVSAFAALARAPSIPPSSHTSSTRTRSGTRSSARRSTPAIKALR